MQKTFLYLLLLLLFGGGVYYFIFYKKNENAFSDKEAGFQIKDTGNIGAIYLAVPSGTSILLNRTDTGWMVNKKYKALMQPVKTLLITLYKQVPKYPAPENSHNNIVTGLAGNGIKVEIYDREGNEMRTFYVGSEAHNYEGTYMLIEGAKKPYVVNLPAFRGILTSRFSTDIDQWRDRSVINLKPEEIRSVSIKYPEEPLNSFTVTQNGKLNVIADPGVIGTNPLNEERVKIFLGLFKNMNSEGYLNGVYGIDTLLRIVPKKAVIDIVTKTGKQQHIDIYWMPINQRSKNQNRTSKNMKEGYDADRYYAVSNNFQDTILIQEYTFGKIFRKAFEFYQADKPVDVIGMDKE